MSAHFTFGGEQEGVFDSKAPARQFLDEVLHLQDRRRVSCPRIVGSYLGCVVGKIDSANAIFVEGKN